VQHLGTSGKRDAHHLPVRAWRELVTDWRLWLFIVLAVLVASVASFLGYD
jgi:hypothetical protein